MKIISSIRSLRKYLNTYRCKNKSIGFVPTMGALHEGHLALIRKCRKENDIVVISIFVNPAQFGLKEDYTAYPRDKKHDCALARHCGCDIVFYPSVSAMYPGGFTASVTVKDISEILCGARRPGHFQGVATVVAKLFNIVEPRRAYFGQKDFQQVVVIRHLIKDLNFPVALRTLATVREKNGLALSSRNSYLSKEQHEEAAVLYRSLRCAKRKILDGERKASRIKSLIKHMIRSTSGTIDYIACVDSKTLEPLTHFEGKCTIALAVFFGKARLIDNIVLQI